MLKCPQGSLRGSLREPSGGFRLPWGFGEIVNLYSNDKPIDTMLEYVIRNRAYDLYVQRGSRDGRALEDWLRAEQEVLASSGCLQSRQ